jgi:hypothetical protein
LRGSWGAGIIIAFLLPLALLLFGILNYSQTLAGIILLIGVWTLISGFAFSPQRDRLFMVGWGLVLSIFSTIFLIRPAYALGLVLLAMIALVLVTAFGKPKAPRGTTASPTASPAAQ